ncbi:MAG: hypothetical protein ACSLEY_02605 [Candidatus Saccharimonadales bacterium]
MRIVQTVFWWGVTILTLFILDDLVFGPAFWAIVLWSPAVATGLAFVASFIFQTWLISAVVKQERSKLASFFLQRFMLERKNKEVARRESSLKRQAASVVGAILVTPLMGSVVPVIVLHEYHVMGAKQFRLFALFLSVVYAMEFALIHGGWGFGALARVVFSS